MAEFEEDAGSVNFSGEPRQAVIGMSDEQFAQLLSVVVSADSSARRDTFNQLEQLFVRRAEPQADAVDLIYKRLAERMGIDRTLPILLSAVREGRIIQLLDEPPPGTRKVRVFLTSGVRELPLGDGGRVTLPSSVSANDRYVRIELLSERSRVLGVTRQQDPLQGQIPQPNYGERS